MPADKSSTASTQRDSPLASNAGTPPTVSATPRLGTGRSSKARVDSTVSRHQAAASGVDQTIEQQKQAGTVTASPTLRTTLASYKLDKSQALPKTIMITEIEAIQQQTTKKKPSMTLEQLMTLPVEQAPLSDVSDQRTANRRSVWSLSPQDTTVLEQTEIDQRSAASG